MHHYCSILPEKQAPERVLVFLTAHHKTDLNEVIGKNAEHFDVVFQNCVLKNRVWVAPPEKTVDFDRKSTVFSTK